MLEQLINNNTANFMAAKIILWLSPGFPSYIDIPLVSLCVPWDIQLHISWNDDNLSDAEVKEEL